MGIEDWTGDIGYDVGNYSPESTIDFTPGNYNWLENYDWNAPTFAGETPELAYDVVPPEIMNSISDAIRSGEYYDTVNGVVVPWDIVVQQDPNEALQILTSVKDWVAANPKEALALGSLLVGGGMALKGLLTPSPEISGGPAAEMLMQRLRAAGPTQEESLAAMRGALRGEFPGGSQSDAEITARANDLIKQILGQAGAGEPDPELSRQIDEERVKLTEYFKDRGMLDTDIARRAMNDFNRKAVESLEQSKTTLRGQKLQQYQGLVQPRSEEELARRNQLMQFILGSTKETSGFGELADLAKSYTYGSAAQAGYDTASAQNWLKAGGILAGYGIAPWWEKTFGAGTSPAASGRKTAGMFSYTG